ncbi:MAG TPA: hypothetical protein VFS85_06385 [Dongiaceae bacterium]|nr:hypothetical protein [Dongiaceae bacterium]
MPAQPRQPMRGNRPSERWRADSSKPTAISGNGKAMRKKPVETGPTSDSLTKMPEKEIETAPRRRIGSASRSPRADRQGFAGRSRADGLV